MKEKKIYMNLDDTQSESKIKEFSKDEVKDELVDQAQEKMLEGIELLGVSGGMATITIPLSILKMFSMLMNQLDNNKENTRC